MAHAETDPAAISAPQVNDSGSSLDAAAARNDEPLILSFAVDGEAVAWAHRVVPLELPPLERLRRLSAALRSPRGLGIVEQPTPTLTAAEAFHTRRANCVAYASLFVGLARALGVPAYYVLVDGVVPTAPLRAEAAGVAVSEGHLAAAWSDRSAVHVFDLGGESAGGRLQLRPITDLAALAVFYSNRGIEALFAGSPRAAVVALRVATELEPVALPSSWVNLGVALRRLGDLDGAQQAYQRALELDPTSRAPYRNLAALLQASGRPREAAALLATADPLASRDVHEVLERAQRSLRDGNLHEARGLYRRALDLAQQRRR